MHWNAVSIPTMQLRISWSIWFAGWFRIYFLFQWNICEWRHDKCMCCCSGMARILEILIVCLHVFGNVVDVTHIPLKNENKIIFQMKWRCDKLMAFMANRIFCYLQQEFLSQFHLENRFDIMITENGGKWRYFHSIYHLCNRNAKVEWKKNWRTDQSKIPCNAQTSSKWATPINFAEKFMDQNGRILRFNIVSRPMILYTTSLLQIFIRSKPMQSQRIFTFKLTAKIYESRKPCVNDVVRERTNNCWLGNITDSNETPCFISFTLNGRYQCWKFILYWSELHETNFFRH